MEKVLKQEEIDAMVQAAQGGAGSPGQATVVTVWDVRHSGQIRREQLQSINTLHEAFARNLTHALAAYLRIGFTANLVSAEHLTFGEFLQRIPDLTYLASFRLSPIGAQGFLQLDLSAAYPLIDVLLGGEGNGPPPERPITGIEEQILETAVRIICRELQTAWQVMALQFEFEQRQQTDQVQRVMASEEKTLSLSFELSIAENRGALNVVFPSVVSSALLRKISSAFVREKSAAQPGAEERLRRHLLRCPFAVELDVTAAGARLQDLIRLKAGDLMPLKHAVEKPALVRVSGEDLFTAKVARSGSSRVAQIVGHIPRVAKAGA